MLDIRLSVVAGGKIEQKIERDEPIPDGWLIDQDGHYVNEGKRYHDEPGNIGVLPLGGMQFGHKGHGLAMMIEMIVGPMALAGCTGGAGGGGIMIMAINIESFMDLDAYKEEIEKHVAYVGSARPLPGFDKIYAPGEIEEANRRKNLNEGIYIPEPTWKTIAETAADLGIGMPKV